MKNRDFIIMAIITLLTVLFWMVFEVIHTSKTSTVAPVVTEQIKPISPNFNTGVLKQLKLRQ